MLMSYIDNKINPILEYTYTLLSRLTEHSDGDETMDRWVNEVQ